jgi:hypothetical protein
VNGLDRIVQAATLLRHRPGGPEGLPERLATDRSVIRSRSQPERGSAFVNGRVVLVAALVAIALLAAGCGGGSASPSVARLGATDATGTSGMSSPSPGAVERRRPLRGVARSHITGAGSRSRRACVRTGCQTSPIPTAEE